MLIDDVHRFCSEQVGDVTLFAQAFVAPVPVCLDILAQDWLGKAGACAVKMIEPMLCGPVRFLGMTK